MTCPPVASAVPAMRRRVAVAVLVALTAFLAPLSAARAQAGDAALGRLLYMDGTGANGAPIAGTIQGDVPVSGRVFSCVSCHRPSGFGTSEGGNYVPPVTGPILFAARQPDRNAMFREMYQEVQPNSYWARVREARMRPAYDRESLGRALREGVDPGGNALSAVMPRYDLSETDLANLAAYLRTLSASTDPGVDETTLHLATVFILVGEIRDAETASVSAQAALTGHLVFSSLHANGSVGAVVRLRDLGIDDFLLAASLRGLIAQRLLRQLCPSCRVVVPPDTLAQRQFEAAHLPLPLSVAQPTGCVRCHNTGYHGRVGVFEIVEITESLRRMITEGASEQALADQALRPDQTLFGEALRRVARHETSMAEALRVVGDLA